MNGNVEYIVYRSVGFVSKLQGVRTGSMVALRWDSTRCSNDFIGQDDGSVVISSCGRFSRDVDHGGDLETDCHMTYLQ